MSVNPYPRAAVARTPPRIITLIALAGFSPLSLNMFMPSLANIAEDLATDYATVSLAISGYLAITAVVQLIVGPLSDRIGRRPVLLGALLVFLVGSVGCALAPDIKTFLFFRMLQGGMTAGYTLSMTIVRDTKSEREAVSLIAYIGMFMALGPMVGPVLGGLLDTAFGWRATFVFYTTAAFLVWIVCWFDLGETRRAEPRTKDTARIGALLSQPLFWAYALCGAFSVGGFFIFITGAPLVARSEFGVSTAELGFYIGTITFGFMIGGFLTGRFGGRFHLTTMMIAGRVIASAGVASGLTLFMSGVTSPLVFFGSTIFVGFGNGLTMPGCNTGVMSVVPKLSGSAAGLHGAMIVGSGSVMTAVTGVLVASADAPAQMLLMMMLTACVTGLCFALLAARLSAR
jgi:Bcr/CflA subfamily drug resistance transporter